MKSDGYKIMWKMIMMICNVMNIRSGFIELMWIVFEDVENF
jgi:hypothetical protein